MQIDKVTSEQLHGFSHKLYDSFLNMLRNNISLFIKRHTNNKIANNGLAEIFANIEQMLEEESALGWETEVASKKSTYKSRFSHLEKNVMRNKGYLKKSDVANIKTMMNYINLLITDFKYISVLKEERGLNISLSPDLESDFQKVSFSVEKYEVLFNQSIKEKGSVDSMLEGMLEKTDILLWESEELVRELTCSLPSNLLYEVDWTILNEYFTNLVLIKGEPVIFNFEAFDKEGNFRFMCQYGLLIVRRPEVENDIFTIFEYENIPDIEMGKIVNVIEIPIKGFYRYIENYLLNNNITYLSPDEKEKLLSFIMKIDEE